MGKKKLIIIISSIAAVIAITVTILIIVLASNSGSKNNNDINGGNSYLDSARTIKIVQIEGSASVTDEEGTADCFKGMNLYDGDKVDVKAESVLVVKFDADKYVYLGEETTINIKSEGKDKFKTNVFVEKGTVLAEIQKPLDVDEEFFLSSNNSVMAVRGTIFGVKVLEKANEFVESYSVFKGVTELFVFDSVDGSVVSGKLTDISNSKLEIKVPKDKILDNTKLTEQWLKDITNEYNNPEDANDKLDEVNITVGEVSKDDYSQVIDAVSPESGTDAPVLTTGIKYKATGFFGSYDGLGHKISVDVQTPNAKVVYRGEKETEYKDTNDYEYILPGSYRVYYKITCEGQDPVENFEVIYITEPNIKLVSDYISYNESSQTSIIDVSRLGAEEFNKYNGVLYNTVMANAEYYIGNTLLNPNNIRVNYNTITEGYMELVNGKNTLNVSFEFDDYTLNTEVNFLFVDSRTDLDYDIAVSNDNLESLGNDLYYYDSTSVQINQANNMYTISGRELLDMFGLEVSDLTSIYINAPYDHLEATNNMISNYDATNDVDLEPDKFTEINFVIFPTNSTKGYNQTIFLYVGTTKPANYPAYTIKSLNYSYNATKTPNGVLMDFVESTNSVSYSIDGKTYQESLYLTEAGSHKVYYKVSASGDSVVTVTGSKIVNVVVGEGEIAFDALKFITKPAYILSTDNNHVIKYTVSDKETGPSDAYIYAATDGRTITTFDDAYLVYSNLIKNAKFYDSITKAELTAKVTISEKKENSADFNYTIVVDGYDTLSGTVKFAYAEFGTPAYQSGTAISVTLPTDYSVKLSDVPTAIPSRPLVSIENEYITAQPYYSIDGGKTWTASVPKITKAGEYDVYVIYCFVANGNDATDLVDNTPEGSYQTSLSPAGNFIITIQHIVVED